MKRGFLRRCYFEFVITLQTYSRRGIICTESSGPNRNRVHLIKQTNNQSINQSINQSHNQPSNQYVNIYQSIVQTPNVYILSINQIIH